MRPKSRKSSATPLVTRLTSPELGDDATFVKRSGKTGRPLRANAGKRKLPEEYVGTEEHMKSLDADDDDDDSFSDGVEQVGDTVRVKNKSCGRKKRRYSPPPPELSPEPELDGDNTEAQLSRSSSTTSPPNELSLTFNVPLGHKGPFIVKLDLGSILGALPTSFNPESMLRTPSLTPTISAPSTTAPKQTTASRKGKTVGKYGKKANVGFMDLPAELRNVIYKHVLVSKEPVNFRSHTNFGHSGALLSTCRQISIEAREVLYGDNEFKFARDGRDRGNFYSQWIEVGWRDIRRFLATIGTENISLLRKLAITFEDPSGRDAHHTHFTDDDHVMEILKLLANYGQLQTLTLSFHGRTMVKRHDTRFLENLKAVRADVCNITQDPNARQRGHYATWYGGRRVANIVYDLDKEVIAKIQRKVKLYDTAK